MTIQTPPCTSCRQPHGYHQFHKIEEGDAIEIFWFCSTYCKAHYLTDDTSSTREFASTGGWV